MRTHTHAVCVTLLVLRKFELLSYSFTLRQSGFYSSTTYKMVCLLKGILYLYTSLRAYLFKIGRNSLSNEGVIYTTVQYIYVTVSKQTFHHKRILELWKVYPYQVLMPKLSVLIWIWIWPLHMWLFYAR